MSKQIDWSKAPDDATHYQAATHGVFECWLKPGHAVRVSRGEPDWRQDDYADDLIATSAIKRPWSGEGLPPVGVVCRIITNNSAWWKYSGLTDGEDVTVCHSFKNSKGYDMVVVEACNGACLAVTVECVAPIRTPEQIAADEREAAIGEMVQAIYLARCSLDCTPLSPADEAKCASAALYDAGFRKP